MWILSSTAQLLALGNRVARQGGIVATSDEVAAFMRTTYMKVFRRSLAVYLSDWGDASRLDIKDETFTARGALTQCHHAAWCDSSEIAKRKFDLAFLDGTDHFELEFYLEALLTIAPHQWRAEQPYPPGQDRFGAITE